MFRRFGLRTTSLLSGGIAAQSGQHHCQFRHTTILCVRKGNETVLIGDRQVTLGERIVAKSSACKLRRLNDKVAVGFAGSTADAFALMEKLEGKLQDFPEQLSRAAVELAKDWRTDKALRRLEASLIVCSAEEVLEIDGQGNVITPEEDGIISIGSGGTYAKAAARALIDVDGYTAESIARKAMKIATDIDVFSNGSWDVEKLTVEEKKEDNEKESEGEGEKERSKTTEKSEEVNEETKKVAPEEKSADGKVSEKKAKKSKKEDGENDKTAWGKRGFFGSFFFIFASRKMEK